MEEKKLAVIALGGNAILRGNQKGTVEEPKYPGDFGESDLSGS